MGICQGVFQGSAKGCASASARGCARGMQGSMPRDVPGNRPVGKRRDVLGDTEVRQEMCLGGRAAGAVEYGHLLSRRRSLDQRP